MPAKKYFTVLLSSTYSLNRSSVRAATIRVYVSLSRQGLQGFEASFSTACNPFAICKIKNLSRKTKGKHACQAP
jgi:hypothetical protein